MTRTKKMSTFDALQGLFLRDLEELKKIGRRGWFVLPTTRSVKEEHLGRCCYLAEEFLNAAELYTLKHELGLDERQWHIYKAKVAEQ